MTWRRRKYSSVPSLLQVPRPGPGLIDRDIPSLHLPMFPCTHLGGRDFTKPVGLLGSVTRVPLSQRPFRFTLSQQNVPLYPSLSIFFVLQIHSTFYQNISDILLNFTISRAGNLMVYSCRTLTLHCARMRRVTVLDWGMWCSVSLAAFTLTTDRVPLSLAPIEFWLLVTSEKL